MSDINLGSNQDCFVTLPNGKRALAVSSAEDPLDTYVKIEPVSPFQCYLMNEQKTDITLTSPAVRGDSIIHVSPGHGFTVNNYAVLVEGQNSLQVEVINVVDDAVGIAIPIPLTFSTNSTVIRGSIEMNIDPTGDTPPSREFKSIINYLSAPVNIETMVIIMVSTGEPDDSKFGDLDKLINGLLFGKSTDNFESFGNYKSNATFREFGTSVEYTDKAGGGLFSTTIIFDIVERYGLPITIDPAENASMLARVRDAFDDLEKMRISVIGYFVPQ